LHQLFSLAQGQSESVEATFFTIVSRKFAEAVVRIIHARVLYIIMVIIVCIILLTMFLDFLDSQYLPI
jgi:hypothetical protein